MSRWSPTVVAEAPPPVRSMLSTALETGVNMYRDQRAQRQRREELDENKRRYEAEQSQQNQWHADQMGQQQRQNQVGDFSRGVDMLEHGYTTEQPPDEGDAVGPAREQWQHRTEDGAVMDGTQQPLGYGVAPDEQPQRLSANSGPAGPDSEAQPNWYMSERQRIKQEAAARYPGSGTVTQTDPSTGQKYYLPVRRQWEDSQMAALNARLQKEREISAKSIYDKQKFDYELKANAAEQERQIRLRAQLRPPAGGVNGPKDPDEIEYNKALGGLGTDIDDERAGIGSAERTSQINERAGNEQGMNAAMAEADQRNGRMNAKTAQRDQMRQWGVQGYKQQKQIVKGVDEAAASLPEIMNNPHVSAADKAAALKDYQATVAAIQQRAHSTKPKSPLGKSLQY